MSEIMDLARKYLSGPFRRSGDIYVSTRCPFHKGGQERRPSFSINTERGTWRCFTCGERGDMRELLTRLGVPPFIVAAEVALLQPYLSSLPKTSSNKPALSTKDPLEAPTKLPKARILGAYHQCPTMLVEQGFAPEVLEKCWVGYDNYNGRITYPLFDIYGNLAGMVGGVTPYSLRQEPKYKVYQGGYEYNGTRVVGDFGPFFDEEFLGYKLSSHDYLFNLPNALEDANTKKDSETVVVVEGFKACLWTVQCGYPRTVALMGTYLSARQKMLLHRLGAELILFLDNDEGGRAATTQIGLNTQREFRVKVANYPPEPEPERRKTQPDSYLPETLHEILQTAHTLTEYRSKR